MSAVSRAIEGIAIRRSRDADVFDRALRGDPVAFAEVYRRYRDRVYAYCLSRLLSRDAAADAMQEVFLRALSADPDKVTSPAGWLFGVARNVCADHARLSARTLSAEQDSHAELPAPDSTEDLAIANQTVSNALVALRRLNPRYRSAIILRDVHRQSMPDIAEALGVDVNAAYTVLSRARDTFGKTYAEVLNLRPACRQAVELSYRRHGSGISPAEKSVLDAHRRSCPACRRETSAAARRSTLAGLALLTQLESAARPSVLATAASTLGSRPWPWEFLARLNAEWPAAKTAATTLIAAGVAAAISLPAGSVPTAPAALHPQSSACTTRSPAPGMGSANPSCTPSGGVTRTCTGAGAATPTLTRAQVRSRALTAGATGKEAIRVTARKGSTRSSGAGSGSSGAGSAGTSAQRTRSGPAPKSDTGGAGAGSGSGNGAMGPPASGSGSTGGVAAAAGGQANESGAGGGSPKGSGSPSGVRGRAE